MQIPPLSFLAASADQAPKIASPFNAQLEATRGIAALMVAGFHACAVPITVNGQATDLIAAASQSASTFERSVASLFWTFLNGDLAVLYFFVLSGFVLSLSLHRDEPPGIAAACRFAIRRLFRIYPAVVFSVLVIAAARQVAGGDIAPDFASVIRNAMLIDVGINGVMWTMQTELIATPLVFLCVALVVYGGVSWLVAVAAGLAALSFIPTWTELFSEKDISRTMLLYAFAFGVLAHSVGRNALRHVAPGRSGAILLFAIVLMFLPHQFSIDPPIVALIQAIASATVVATIAYATWDEPVRLLTRPAARVLGRISFSFYLLHPLTLIILWPMAPVWTSIVDGGSPPSVLILALWALTSAATALLAAFSFRYVESPAIAYGRWTSQWLSRPLSRAAAGARRRISA